MHMKAAIFDMDGTLIDSLIFWEYLWKDLGRRFLQDENFCPTQADDIAVRTLTMREAMALIHRNYNIGPDPVWLWHYVDDVLLDFYKTKVQLKPGAKEFLEFCRQSGTKMCIASASSAELVKAALSRLNLEQYFLKIFSCADLGFGKERPDIYLQAQDFMGEPIGQTWVFEDSLKAIQTASQAGFPTVGIYDPNNYGHAEMKAVATRYVGPDQTLLSLQP